MSNETSTPIDDFDAQLRAALHADADRAPQTDRPWEGPTGAVVRLDQHRRRRRRPLVFVAAGLTAAAAVAAIAIRTTGDDRAVQPVMEPATTVSTTVTSTVPTSGPSGTEVPLVPGTATISRSSELDSFTQSYSLPNGDAVTEIRTLAYVIGVEPMQSRCVGFDVCDHGTGDPAFGPVSFVGVAAPKVPVWTWINVPEGTAYVSYDAGDQHLWQTPQQGIVAFPEATDVSDRTVVAHAADGSVLAQIDPSTPPSTLASSYQLPELTTAQLDQMDVLTTSALHECLAGRGVTVVADGNATAAADVDLPAAWTDCAATAVQTVRDAITALDVPVHQMGGTQPTPTIG